MLKESAEYVTHEIVNTCETPAGVAGLTSVAESGSIPRCTSPQCDQGVNASAHKCLHAQDGQYNECEGDGCVCSPTETASVISISASADAEWALEDPSGVSMTQVRRLLLVTDPGS